MKKRKSAYELNKKGEIIGYNPNYDTERYAFISDDCSLFEKMLKKVNLILNSMIDTKPYTIDWKDVIDGYKERGIGDVPHYASQYVLAYFLIEQRAEEKVNMHAMYLEIIDTLNQEIENGSLPSNRKV